MFYLKWLGRPYYQVEEITGKMPDALTRNYDQDLVKQLFDSLYGANYRN